jgi:hypothetical protein
MTYWRLEFSLARILITKYKDGYEGALIFDGLQLRNNDTIDDEI